MGIDSKISVIQRESVDRRVVDISSNSYIQLQVLYPPKSIRLRLETLFQKYARDFQDGD